MTANFGGTEFFNPLSYIYDSCPVYQNYPRNIFVLTDGDVGNNAQILNLVEKN